MEGGPLKQSSIYSIGFVFLGGPWSGKFELENIIINNGKIQAILVVALKIGSKFCCFNKHIG